MILPFVKMVSGGPAPPEPCAEAGACCAPTDNTAAVATATTNAAIPCLIVTLRTRPAEAGHYIAFTVRRRSYRVEAVCAVSYTTRPPTIVITGLISLI